MSKKPYELTHAYPHLTDRSESKGLTKLEIFTMAAMQALISNTTTMGHINKLAREDNELATTQLSIIAIDFAKATLLELSKQ